MVEVSHNNMEMMDIVDLNDEVVGEASRQEIYAKNLRHRIVHVLLFDKQGKMALQKRSSKVGFCPLHWSTAVGGHVQKGESYEQAANREYKEELGLTTDFNFMSKDFYQVEGRPDKFLVTFKAEFEGPFKLDPEEVEKVEFFTIDEIKTMVANGEKFHPELLFLLKKHFVR